MRISGGRRSIVSLQEGFCVYMTSCVTQTCHIDLALCSAPFRPMTLNIWPFLLWLVCPAAEAPVAKIFFKPPFSIPNFGFLYGFLSKSLLITQKRRDGLLQEIYIFCLCILKVCFAFWLLRYGIFQIIYCEYELVSVCICYW